MTNPLGLSVCETPRRHLHRYRDRSRRRVVWPLRWRERGHGHLLPADHSEWLRAAVFWGAAAIPVGVWFGRNFVVLGDPTGMSAMIQWAGTPFKPAGQLFDHPIFGLDGAVHFFSLFTSSFWRGEYFWHGVRLRHAGADFLYQIGTLVAVGAAALRLAAGTGPTRARQAETLALLTVAVAVLTLVGLSIAQEFPEGGVVSSREPYIFFGRYVTGVTVPALILFARGVGVLGGLFPERFRSAASWGLLLTVAATALISEAVLTARALDLSPYGFRTRAVGLRVDFDLQITRMASALYRLSCGSQIYRSPCFAPSAGAMSPLVKSPSSSKVSTRQGHGTRCSRIGRCGPRPNFGLSLFTVSRRASESAGRAPPRGEDGSQRT